jgi:hypothetical protein
MYKDKIIGVLEKLRKQQCRCSGHCNCRLGGRDIDSLCYYGKEKGARELDLCLNILKKLTPKEISDIMNR